MQIFALFLALLASFLGSPSMPPSLSYTPTQSHVAPRIKGYVTCPSHYYYNVGVHDIHHRGLLDTLQKVADSYKVPLEAVQEYNPLAAALTTLPIGMSICVPYHYTG